MGIENGLGGMEKHNPVYRGKNFFNHGALIGIHDLRQQLALLHPGVDLSLSQEEPRGIALDVDHRRPFDELGQVASVAGIVQNAVFSKESQHRFHDNQCPGGINFVCGVGVNGEGLGIPDLPVIVEGGGVIGPGFPAVDIGKAEVPGFVHVLKAGFHHPHMGCKASLGIMAGEVDAVVVVVDTLENPGGNPLGGLAQIIAREHAVDIRVVRRPEPFSDVHGMAVHRGNHQNGLSVGDSALLLQPGKDTDKLGADVHLLDFVSPGGAYDADGVFTLTKGVALP